MKKVNKSGIKINVVHLNDSKKEKYKNIPYILLKYLEMPGK
jgi:hypothetical protein